LKKGHYIHVYGEKGMIGFKLMMFGLEKRDLKNDIHLLFVFLQHN